MSADREDEYLDMNAIAALCGIKPKSIIECRIRGHMPEPDIYFLKHPLWLVETIEAWRAQRYQRHRLRAPIPRRDIATPSRPPKLARPDAKVPKKTQDKRSHRKTSSAGALEKPSSSSISEKDAAVVAADLRSTGHYCTTADVMVLVDVPESELAHDRLLLQQRIRQQIARRRKRS